MGYSPFIWQGKFYHHNFSQTNISFYNTSSFVPSFGPLTCYAIWHSFLIHFIIWQDDSSLIKLWISFFTRLFCLFIFSDTQHGTLKSRDKEREDISKRETEKRQKNLRWTDTLQVQWSAEFKKGGSSFLLVSNISKPSLLIEDRVGKRIGEKKYINIPVEWLQLPCHRTCYFWICSLQHVI